MYSIALKVYWKKNGVLSSEVYALKDSLEEAVAFAKSQQEHYRKQGFYVTYQIFHPVENNITDCSAIGNRRPMSHPIECCCLLCEPD